MECGAPTPGHSRATTSEKMTQGLGSMFFPGGTGDSLELFDGRDLRAPVRVAFVVRKCPRRLSYRGDGHPHPAPAAIRLRPAGG